MRKEIFISVVFFLVLTLITLGCATTPPAEERVDAGKYLMIAIGDSITHGDTGAEVLGHKNTIQGGWVTRLKNKLEEDSPGEYEVINKGINGDTAKRVLNRLNKDLISYQPNIVILAVGTNDTHDLLLDPFRGGNAKDYRVVMEEILAELQLNLPNTPVFIMGMTTTLRKYWMMAWYSFFISLPQQETLEGIYEEYNNVLKDLAQDYGYFYVDISSQWPKDVEGSWEFYADGIHPNNVGYDKMTEVLYRALRTKVISLVDLPQNK